MCDVVTCMSNRSVRFVALYRPCPRPIYPAHKFVGPAMYHAHAACPYRQGPSVARDRCERGHWHIGIARRASLLGVPMRPGRAVECFGTPRAGIEPGGGVGVCT